MANIQLQTDPRVELELEGTIAIASAARLKEALAEALRANKDISVSLEKASSLDVTAVQLLWSAARAAKIAGLRFHYSGPVPEQILAGLSEAGMDWASLWEGAL